VPFLYNNRVARRRCGHSQCGHRDDVTRQTHVVLEVVAPTEAL
jgi:hypothetical protein